MDVFIWLTYRRHHIQSIRQALAVSQMRSNKWAKPVAMLLKEPLVVR